MKCVFNDGLIFTFKKVKETDIPRYVHKGLSCEASFKTTCSLQATANSLT